VWFPQTATGYWLVIRAAAAVRETMGKDFRLALRRFWQTISESERKNNAWLDIVGGKWTSCIPATSPPWRRSEFEDLRPPLVHPYIKLQYHNL